MGGIIDLIEDVFEVAWDAVTDFVAVVWDEVVMPILEEVFSSVLPCEEAAGQLNWLKWLECGTEANFIYTNCCELPEGNYKIGVTTSKNFVVEGEVNSSCFTFQGPATIPDGAEPSDCPEDLQFFVCGSEDCPS